MEMNDDEPTEAELREAEALARALDRGHAAPGTPEDALRVAALLRHAKDGGALDAAKADAILTDALAQARPVRARQPLRWPIFGALGLAAAGAFAALVVARAPAGDSTPILPPPPRALLEAEINAADSRVATLDALNAETRSYRATLYGALRDRYGR